MVGYLRYVKQRDWYAYLMTMGRRTSGRNSLKGLITNIKQFVYTSSVSIPHTRPSHPILLRQINAIANIAEPHNWCKSAGICGNENFERYEHRWTAPASAATTGWKNDGALLSRRQIIITFSSFSCTFDAGLFLMPCGRFCLIIVASCFLRGYFVIRRIKNCI